MMSQTLFHLGEFITNNQTLLIALLFVSSYFLKRIVDYLAAKPQKDIWDTIKPASDALYQLVHRGVELMAARFPMSSADKLLTYEKRLSIFEATWNQQGPAAAIRELAAWYLSVQLGESQAATATVTATVTADTPATP